MAQRASDTEREYRSLAISFFDSAIAVSHSVISVARSSGAGSETEVADSTMSVKGFTREATAFAQGGQGTTQLAQHVIDACTQPTELSAGFKVNGLLISQS